MARLVRLERELRVRHLEEKPTRTLREDFHLPLTGGLAHEVRSFARDIENESRRELISPGESSEFLVERYLLPNLRQRRRRSEKMPPMFESASGVRVGEDDNSGTPLRIEADEGSVSAGPSVVPCDLRFAVRRDVPAEGDLEAGGAGRAARVQHRGHRRTERRFRQTEGRGE